MSRRSSDLEDSQVKFEPGSSDGEQLWEAIEIVKEDPKRGFLVRWAGNDPNTGKPWPNSWSLREDCTDDLVQEWREKQRAAKGAYLSCETVRSSEYSLSSLEAETHLAHLPLYVYDLPDDPPFFHRYRAACGEFFETRICQPAAEAKSLFRRSVLTHPRCGEQGR
ncbi:hypothetical protein FA95DRAFT_891089 [Auriscalpium vulgare]|uniref:Uncharacterized protein n=1 Tax=Auriscalpium vulgare TaxID=40419 RepID=A0ACB8RZP3_9AGAM|nr:hypothetical protein FA95DRAFT_891089 [Auriscalpium vulgare]